MSGAAVVGGAVVGGTVVGAVVVVGSAVVVVVAGGRVVVGAGFGAVVVVGADTAAACGGGVVVVGFGAAVVVVVVTIGHGTADVTGAIDLRPVVDVVVSSATWSTRSGLVPGAPAMAKPTATPISKTNTVTADRLTRMAPATLRRPTAGHFPRTVRA